MLVTIFYNVQEVLDGTVHQWTNKQQNLSALQVVDLKDFKFLINNHICNQSQISLVTIISSAINHEVGYGKEPIENVNMNFVLGRPTRHSPNLG